MADCAEQCELQARLIEEKEDGEMHLQPIRDESRHQPQATAINPSVEFALKEKYDADQVRPTPDDAGRTARRVSDHNLGQIGRSRKMARSRLTWNDELETTDQRRGCTEQGRGVDFCSGPLSPLTLEKNRR